MERPSMILDVDGEQQLYEWKLGEYSSHVEPAFEFTRRYINELEAENAKLRELCADIYEEFWYEYPTSAERQFHDRMRDLGVEVEP